MRLDVWLALASARLAEAGVEAARTEARVLARYALDVESVTLFAHPELDVPPDADEFLERRLVGEPLSYIVGYREFFGRRFRVTPAVLIPRQETEVLVETVMRLALPAAQVLDIGVGSGCIAITLKLERPDLVVTGVDLSPDAVIVADENATVLGADVELVEADLFAPGLFDLIVSNPPYIEENTALPRDIGEYEPKLALFAGVDGLDIYRRLAREAGAHLGESGLIAIELGDGMRMEVEEIFLANGWVRQELAKDLLRIDRVLVFSVS